MKQLGLIAIDEVRKMPAVQINDIISMIVEDLKDIAPESFGVLAEQYVSQLAEKIKPYVSKLPIPTEYVDEVAEIIVIYAIEHFLKPTGLIKKVLRGVKIKVIADVLGQLVLKKAF